MTVFLGAYHATWRAEPDLAAATMAAAVDAIPAAVHARRLAEPLPGATA